MTLDADRLLATPDYHFLSFEGDSGLFLPMDRRSYHQSAFLDGRATGLSSSPLRQPLGPLLNAARDHRPPRLGWIFHIARCGSTLLSRLIDGEKSSLVLREPPPLRQVGLDAASAERGGRWPDRLRLAHAMAARRFDPDRPTVVKANVPVNFILRELRQLDGEAPSILLYFALEPYLLAILRAPPHRIWVERIADQLAPALASRVGLTSEASIGERAAALWLAQMLEFEALIDAYPAAQSLDANQLFAAPAATAEASAAHLGIADLPIDENVATWANSYAKDASKPFDEGLRVQRLADDRRRLDPELAEARRWLDNCPAARQLPERLGRPLIGEAAILLA